jgi:predicted dehydrogenase
MKQMKVAVLGAGARGNVYGDYLLQNPHEGTVVAAADAAPHRLASFAARHGLPDTARFTSWEALLDARPEVDAVIITTQDRMHTAPALRALALGYHVLLEKPISPDPTECLAIADAAERHGRVLTVCHVLRYTPYMTAVKELLESGAIGRLLSIQWTENVGWYHMAHSFVRGNWRRTDESSPMILAKSCHDLDLLHWLAGSDCLQVSSFGGLSHFRPENAPPGAPLRCTDGCPVEPACAYSALKIYTGDRPSWLVNAMTADSSAEGRLKALREGPYGRCAFHCDNDVVDHQVVNLAYANGVTVSFSMVGFTKEINRTAKLFGTEGEMRLNMNRNEIEINHFSGRTTVVTPEIQPGGHNGGDSALMRSFLRDVRSGGGGGSLTSARVSAQTHLLAFAAEESRLTGQTVDFLDYVKQVHAK